MRKEKLEKRRKERKFLKGNYQITFNIIIIIL